MIAERIPDRLCPEHGTLHDHYDGVVTCCSDCGLEIRGARCHCVVCHANFEGDDAHLAHLESGHPEVVGELLAVV